MADIDSNTPIFSRAVTDPVVVSKDTSANLVTNPIFVNLSDGSTGVSITSTSLDVNVTNASVIVTATNLDIRDLTHVTDSIRLGDGTNLTTVSAAGSLQIDIAEQSLTAVAISKNSSANTEINPIYVEVVEGGASSNELIDYDTVSALAVDTSSNHDYTVTATKTLIVRKVIVSASGAAKWEVQSGPVASLLTDAVKFTTAAHPSEEFDFQGRLEVPDTSTGTLRIIRTNRDEAAQDLYSSIIGNEV